MHLVKSFVDQVIFRFTFWLSLTNWSFEGHCFLEGSDFHQHFGFWEFCNLNPSNFQVFSETTVLKNCPFMKFCKGQFYEVFRLARYRIEHQHRLIKNKIELKIFLDFDKFKGHKSNILWMLSIDITANVMLIYIKWQDCLKIKQ